MNFLGNFFNGDNDEVLFFILVFLLLFSGNFRNGGFTGDDEGDSNTLFFIILFLLLFGGVGLADGHREITEQ